jgi:HSP20 family protein
MDQIGEQDMRYGPKETALLFLPFAATASEMSWHPSVDIYSSRRGWLIKFELAGVQLKDISIKAQGSRLTLTGERRDWVVKDDWSHYSLEIAYNRFERTIELPCDLERAAIRTEYHDGLLLIRVAPEGERR